MAAKSNAPATRESTADREILLTRTFQAPRELVWRAWTEPEHVAQWWGPTGFSLTISEMDVRAGGVWSVVMHGPDGTHYPNKMVYDEVVKPERLVYTSRGGSLDQLAEHLAKG